MKNQKVILGVVGGCGLLLCIICSTVFYFVGNSCAINKEVLQEKLAKNEEYVKLTDDVKRQQDLLNELKDYKNNKESKTAEITQLDNDIASKSSKISSLDNDIATKSAELDRLKNVIQLTGEAPKVLPAGHYTVGSDIQPGRYTVTGKSNFVVYSSHGSLKVNTILGGGNWGEESYTCTLENGDTLELSSKDTFTPIK